MLRERVLILFFIFVHLRDSSCFIDSLYDAGNLLWKLYANIDKLEFHTNSTFEEIFISENESNKEIKILLFEIDEQMNRSGESMSFGASRETLKSSSSYMILYRDLDIVEIFAESIDKYYEKFHRYMNGAISYSNEKFKDFVQKMTLDVVGAIQVLRRILADEKGLSVGRKNLVSVIGDYAINQRAEICDGPQIISTILVQLFEILMLAEMKSSLMLSFTNIYQYMENTDEWKRMNSLSRMQFERQFGIYVSLFTTNLIKSDLSYLRACDPDNGTWTQNNLSYEMEGSIQATIFRYYSRSCERFSCNEIWSEKAQQCQTQYHNYRSVCHDTLMECAYLGAVQACQLKSGPHKFLYVNSTELGFLGRNLECPKDNGDIIQDGSGEKYNGRVCACNCYWDHNKISLAIIQSEVERNRVIISLRFLRIDRILYIQPRQGKLGKNGRIIRYSEKWVSIPEYIEESDIHPVNRMNRVFFFDDLNLPLDYVLTGIKFIKVKREHVEGFAIKIFGSLFDYRSGKINSDEQFQKSEQAPNDYPGKPLSFTAVSSPYTNLTNIVSPEDIKYVSLKRSTLRDDFGQSTLPLFDAIPIKSNPSSPLGGIGIFHKGAEGYAGFISIRVYGINYVDYLKQFESSHLTDGRVKFNYS